MELTTKTAQELKLAIENQKFFGGKAKNLNRYKEGYAHGSKDAIISLKNELKEIMNTEYSENIIVRIRYLIQEIESIETSKDKNMIGGAMQI